MKWGFQIWVTDMPDEKKKNPTNIAITKYSHI